MQGRIAPDLKQLRRRCILQKAKRILEHAPFGLGVSAVVAMVMSYCVSGGPIPPWVFAVAMEGGVIGGLVMYLVTGDEQF
jgi:hypothetical protein